MSTRRIARLGEQMKREISDIIRSDVRDPRIGLPTVIDVEVTADLWLARIYVRADPTFDDVRSQDFLDALSTAAPFIRRRLGGTLRLRRVPELRFIADRTFEEAERVENILREVRDGDPDGTGTDPSSSEDS